LPEEKRRPLVAVSIHWQFTKPLAPPAQGAPWPAQQRPPDPPRL